MRPARPRRWYGRFGIEEPFPWVLIALASAPPIGLVLAAAVVWTALCRGWLVDTTAPL